VVVACAACRRWQLLAEQAAPVIAAFKRRVRQVIGRFGYDVVPSRDLEGHTFVRHLQELFGKLDIQCVLDVGANRGQYRHLLRDRVGYQGLIISFEPLSRNVASLREQAEADPRWIIRGHALGTENTEMEINVMKADGLSSFRSPHPAMVPMFRPVNVIERRERVEVRRLDSVIGELGGARALRNVYLKLDTQGFDLEVVRGAAATISKVRALQTEISMQPLYREAPSHRETLDELTERGFAVTAMYPIVRDELMRVIEFDCVMVNGAAAE
jgi:FkbM family methyltransferase